MPNSRTIRDILLIFVAILTRRPRYHPEDYELSGKLNWTNKLWIANVFRAYEWLFGKGFNKDGGTQRAEIGAGAELSRDGKLHFYYKLYSFEAHIVHIEVLIRLYLKTIFEWLKSFSFPRPTLDPFFQPIPQPVYLTLGILGFLFTIKTNTNQLPLILGLIGFDTNPNSGNAVAPGTSISYTHVSTGSNLLMFFGVEMSSGGDIFSAAAYNGDGATQIRKDNTDSGYDYIYRLINPDTGSNTVTGAWDGTSRFARVHTTTFTGVSQSAPIDSNNVATAANATSLSPATTVVAANCWLAALFAGGGGSVAADVATNGTTFRSQDAGDRGVMDSNGTVGTGSQALRFTQSANVNISALIASIAPATGVVYTETYNEIITIVESIPKTISRSLAEVVIIVESIPRTISRTLADILAIDDSTSTFARIIAAVMNEVITVTDTITRSISRALAETIVIAETISRSIGKALTEVITLVETIANTQTFGRRPLMKAASLLKSVISAIKQ